MEFMKGIQKKETTELADLLTGAYTGKTVSLNGAVHTIRDMGEVSFVILRKGTCPVCQRALCSCIQGRGCPRERSPKGGGRQAGIRGQRAGNPFGRIKGESAVTVTGIVSPEPRAPHGVEIRLTGDQSTVNTGRGSPHRCQQMEAEHVAGDEAGPSPYHTPQSHGAGEIPDSGRNCPGIPGFSSLAGILPRFAHRRSWPAAQRRFNVFRLDYFNKKAELGQSPQFYKQTMVGVYDRVFEAAPCSGLRSTTRRAI